MWRLHIEIAGVLLLGGGFLHLHAEAGEDAWLRYAPLESATRVKYKSLPANLGIECVKTAACSASIRFDRAAGVYEMDVQYFDQNNGASKFSIFVDNGRVDEWVANDHLPAMKPSGDSSTRRRISGLALRPGDEIRIEGIPDGEEHPPLDYIELHAATE